MLGYLGGPEGVFNDQTGPILLFSYPLTHIYVHVTCQIRKQSDKKFLSLNPKYEIFHIWGSLCRTQVNESFRTVRPLHRADICITREKTASFSYMGHNIQKCEFLAIRGALDGP